MKLILVLLVLSQFGCYRVVAGYGLKPKVYFPVTDPSGGLTNIGSSAEANQNAIQHAIAGTAIPLGARYFGRKPMWYAGATWIGYTLLEEVAWHAPDQPDKSYPSEVRADLLSRIIPTLIVLGVDYLINGSPFK